MAATCVCGRPATVVKSGYPWCDRCWQILDDTVEYIGLAFGLPPYVGSPAKDPTDPTRKEP